MEEKKKVEGTYLMFGDRPFVRSNNLICYGDMTEDYVLFLIILSNRKVPESTDGVEVPDHILVQVLSTDPKKLPHERIEKQFEKNSLYDAMEIGLVWLDRLNAAS